MNKTVDVIQYGYTYVVKCKYHEGDEVFCCFCSDSYSVSLKEIEQYLDLEEGDEFEIIYQWSNDFNFNDVLSDKIIYQLKGDCTLNDKEYTKYSIGYISFVYNNCISEKEQYKKDVLSQMLRYIDLRRQNLMTIYVATEILKIFGIEIDERVNLRKQIELNIEPNVNEDILYQLSKKGYAKIVGHHLDKIGSAYKIYGEKSIYRIGILFLRMYEGLNERGFLSSTFNNNGKIKNYTKLMRLMSSYYGISTPTYREAVLRMYKENGAKSTLFNTIRNEHIDVWLSLMK